MKLKIKVQRFYAFGKQCAALQIVEQSERAFNSFKAKNGWSINSIFGPAIDDLAKIIFLRGSHDSQDNRIMFTNRPDEVIEALREFAAHVADNRAAIGDHDTFTIEN